MRILVIDDDAFALRLATHQLGKLGFTDVTALARPEDALERLEHDVAEFDMVLLDLQMPGIDGVEFVRHLARLRFAGGVALVSGEDERILQTAHRLARAHDLEVRGALHKPITPEQLSALLGPPGTGPRRSRAARKTYTADRLAQAIAAGELVNVYQPQVALYDNRTVGIEALAYLSELPVAELKIDRAFVRGAVDGTRDRAIVRTVASLGRDLGLRVCAEGVEDARALDLVRELGCATAQGYHIARPMPFGALEGWLQTGLRRRAQA